jgi:hypothetical protein
MYCGVEKELHAFLIRRKPQNLVLFYSKNGEERKRGTKIVNKQINPKQTFFVPRYSACRVVEVTGLSEKWTAS